MPRQDLCQRAIDFSAAVLQFCEPLLRDGPLYTHISLQLFRATSSIGANLEEGQAPSSRRDMAAKYGIALRESREARYWLRLTAYDSRFRDAAVPLIREATEMVDILTASVRNLRDPQDPD